MISCLCASELPWTCVLFLLDVHRVRVDAGMGIGTRAMATHEWNLKKFGNKYPKNRKRLIPLVW